MEELDLKELFYMFWSRRIHIIAIVAVFIVIGIIYSYIFVSPVYMSYTTLVLATSSENATTSSGTITTTDITLNNNLVATYSELIRSKTVLREVIDNLGISRSESSLKSSVSVSQVKSTQIIQINVTDASPRQARLIADEIAKVFTVKVSEIYNINNVHVVDKAEENDIPYNVSHMKDIVIFAFIGLVVASGYVLVANMLDTTVKTQEDVERKLKLTVLTTIPLNNFDDVNKGGRK